MATFIFLFHHLRCPPKFDEKIQDLSPDSSLWSFGLSRSHFFFPTRPDWMWRNLERMSFGDTEYMSHFVWRRRHNVSFLCGLQWLWKPLLVFEWRQRWRKRGWSRRRGLAGGIVPPLTAARWHSDTTTLKSARLLFSRNVVWCEANAAAERKALDAAQMTKWTFRWRGLAVVDGMTAVVKCVVFSGVPIIEFQAIYQVSALHDRM